MTSRYNNKSQLRHSGGGGGSSDGHDKKPTRILGKGAYGKVWTDGKMVIKSQIEVQEKFGIPTNFIREVDTYMRLSKNTKHVSILLPFHSFHIEYRDREPNSYRINLSVGTLSLFHLSKKLPLTERIKYFDSIIVQVGLALYYLHDQGLLHRDIKPGNCLVTREKNSDKYRIYLIDFGTICDMRGSAEGGVTTESSCAPEILSSKSHCTVQSDIYALGSTLLNFLCHTDHCVDHVKRRDILKNTYSRQIPEHYVELINAMTDLNPNRRPSLTKILNLPWLRTELQKNIDLYKLVNSRINSTDKIITADKHLIDKITSVCSVYQYNQIVTNLVDICKNHGASFISVVNASYMFQDVLCCNDHKKFLIRKNDVNNIATACLWISSKYFDSSRPWCIKESTSLQKWEIKIFTILNGIVIRRKLPLELQHFSSQKIKQIIQI